MDVAEYYVLYDIDQKVYFAKMCYFSAPEYIFPINTTLLKEAYTFASEANAEWFMDEYLKLSNYRIYKKLAELEEY